MMTISRASPPPSGSRNRKEGTLSWDDKWRVAGGSSFLINYELVFALVNIVLVPHYLLQGSQSHPS